MKDRGNKCKEILANPYVLYTILFAMIVLIGYFPLILGYFELPWKGDGMGQYFPFLTNFKQDISALVREAKFPGSWDWYFGLGGSTFSKYVYYNIGDIFSYLGALAPTKHLATWYGILVFLRVYLAGLSGLFLIKSYRYTGKSPAIVANVYAWSPLVVYNIVRHPMFITPFIFFPLIIFGINKLLEGKGNKFLIIITFFAIISNFYFAWQMALGSLVYVLIRYFSLSKTERKLWDFTKKFVWPVVILIGLTAFFVLPLIKTVLSMSRSDDIFANGIFLYNLKYYLTMPLTLFGYYRAGNYWMIGGFVVLTIPAIVYSIRNFKRYKVLNLSLLACLLVILFPVLASLTVLGGSPIHRWMFILSLVFAMSIMNFLGHLSDVTRKDILISLYVYFIVLGMWFVGNGFNFGDSRYIWSAIFLLVSVIVFLSELSIYKIKSLLGVILLVNISCNLVAFNSSRQGDSLNEALAMKGTSQWQVDNAFLGLPRDMTTVENRLHIDNKLAPLTTGNAASVKGIYNTLSYNSVQNKYISDLISEEFNYASSPTRPLTRIDNDPTVLKLLGVKYLVLGNDSHPPLGYSNKMKTTEGYELYEADKVLPFMYLRSDKEIVSEEMLSELTSSEKITYLTNHTVIDSNLNKPKEKTQSENLNIRLVDIDTDKEIELKDKVTLKANGSYELKIKDEIADNSNIYVSFDNIEQRYLSISDKYNNQVDSNKVKIEELEEKLKSNPTSVKTKIELDELKKFEEEHFYSKYNYTLDKLMDSANGRFKLKLSSKTKNYTIDNGLGKQSENGLRKISYKEYNLGKEQTKIVLNNESPNDLEISNLGAFAYSRNKQEESDNISYVIAEDYTVDNNVVSTTIKADKQSILASRIPYSEGWKVFVDGKPAKIERVNYAFTGVKLPKGKHVVTFVYKEPGLLLGGLISSLTIIGLAIVSLLKKQYRRY